MYTLKIKKFKVNVDLDSIKDVKEYVRKLRDEYSITGSSWDWHGSHLYKDGDFIGTVSYNGTCWDIYDKEITE